MSWLPLGGTMGGALVHFRSRTTHVCLLVFLYFRMVPKALLENINVLLLKKKIPPVEQKKHGPRALPPSPQPFPFTE